MTTMVERVARAMAEAEYRDEGMTWEITAGQAMTDSPQADLRWVRRNGRLVLQQLVAVASATKMWSEWRDVPLVGDESK